MSTQTPAIGIKSAWSERADPAKSRGLSELTLSTVFEPRRSTLVSWTIRAAQVADQVVAYTRATRHDGQRVVEQPMVEKALNGWDRVCRLTPKKSEVVAAERARLVIQKALNSRPEPYNRFRCLRRSALADNCRLVEASPFWIHLNPARCWIMVDGLSAGSHETSSRNSLFFLDGQVLRGLQMDLEGQVLINELADYQPCTINQWARLSSLVDASQLIDFVCRLAAVGLVAYG